MADVVETSSNGERACVELSSSYVAEGTKVDGGGRDGPRGSRRVHGKRNGYVCIMVIYVTTKRGSGRVWLESGRQVSL